VARKLTKNTAEIWGAMALSAVFFDRSEHYRQVVSWYATCHRLGIRLPIFVIHDLGALLSSPRGTSYLILERREVLRRLNLSRADAANLLRYRLLLERLAASRTVSRVCVGRLEERLVGVLLAKVLRLLYLAWIAEGGPDFSEAALLEHFPEDLADHAKAFSTGFLHCDRERLLRFCAFVCNQEPLLLSSLDQVNLDTLKLLAVFPSQGGASLEEMADLWRIFTAPQLGDVARFSMELLPSVYETKRLRSEQFFSFDGYAGIARRGTLDSVLPTELAHDEELFLQKFLDRDLFFHSHLREEQQESRLFYLLVDASASMRGRRSVFARGLALGLAKRLLLKGYQVLLRYFDARLGRLFVLDERSWHLPAILSYPSDGPRDPAACLRELSTHLNALSHGERRLEVVFITHYECSFPPELLEKLRRKARLTGLFLFPTRVDLEPVYLGQLDHVRIIQEADLLEGENRVRSARSVLLEF
jgi:hypothetical protein